jgi:hypothetical protein
MSKKVESAKPIVYRGVVEISAAVGINRCRFKYYRITLGLPVFKADEGSKVWLATHDDLMIWVEGRKSWWKESR